MQKLKWFNLALRAIMEFGIVIALAIWGYHMGESVPTRIALGIAAPLVGFGTWGLVDFHQAGKLGEPLRLVEELVISGLAALAWYAAGQHFLGISLGAISLVYHTFVYISGDRLLKLNRPLHQTEFNQP